MSVELIAPSEDLRLRAVADYGLSPDVMQGDLEPLNRLANALFGVPTSMVSIVAQYHTFFASRIGIAVCEVDRNISFCHTTITQDEPLIILDASLDPNFRDNPLVNGPAHVRFYAGAPLIGPSGATIGSFCLLDTRPRAAFTPADVANLKLLATLALDKMELRRLARAHQAGENRFRQMSATSPAGIICADREGSFGFGTRAPKPCLAIRRPRPKVGPSISSYPTASVAATVAASNMLLPAGNQNSLVSRSNSGLGIKMGLSYRSSWPYPCGRTTES